MQPNPPQPASKKDLRKCRREIIVNRWYIVATAAMIFLSLFIAGCTHEKAESYTQDTKPDFGPNVYVAGRLLCGRSGALHIEHRDDLWLVTCHP